MKSVVKKLYYSLRLISSNIIKKSLVDFLIKN